MHKQETDEEIEAFDDKSLRARLEHSDWKNDPLFVTDERVFRLFRRARAAGDKSREGLLSAFLSHRILERSRTFVIRSRIFPGLIDDLRRAADELASCIWDHLLSSESDARHAEKAFGQLFDRRAISFQRSLLSKKRTLQDSLNALDDDFEEESTAPAAESLEELQDWNTPEVVATHRQEFERVKGRLLELLTPNEYATYALLHAGDWQVQEIAAALGVTVRSVNNYKNSARAKIDKEFKQ